MSLKQRKRICSLHCWRQYYWLLLTCSEYTSEKSEMQTNAIKTIKLDLGLNNFGLSLDCDHNQRQLGENELAYAFNIYIYIFTFMTHWPYPYGHARARVCGVFASKLVSTTSEVKKGWLSTDWQNFSNPHYCKLRDQLNRTHVYNCTELSSTVGTPHYIITMLMMYTYKLTNRLVIGLYVDVYYILWCHIAK